MTERIWKQIGHVFFHKSPSSLLHFVDVPVLWSLKESVKVASWVLHEQISEIFDEQIVDIPRSTNGRAAHRRAHRAVPDHEV